MRRADPGNQQARAIERISEEALRDMQALLVELRTASLDGAGLTPALQDRVQTAIFALRHQAIATSTSRNRVEFRDPHEHADHPFPRSQDGRQACRQW